MTTNESLKNSEIINMDAKSTVLLPLSVYVKQAIEEYLTQLSGHDATGLHALVINEVEKPLLEIVLEHSKDNQSQAAKWLGISRNTLRKLISVYKL